MLALAFLDEIFIFDVFMTGLTVEPGPKQIQFRKREREREREREGGLLTFLPPQLTV